VHTQLRAACIKLEELEEHVVAAYVGHAIALVEERFGIGGDHDDDEPDAC